MQQNNTLVEEMLHLIIMVIGNLSCAESSNDALRLKGEFEYVHVCRGALHIGYRSGGAL